MRTIDAEPIERKFQNLVQSYRGTLGAPIYNLALQEIQAAPTVAAGDAAPGYWQLFKEDSSNNRSKGWRCSQCKGYHFHNAAMLRKYKYCPNCGARMKNGGIEDGAEM